MNKDSRNMKIQNVSAYQMFKYMHRGKNKNNDLILRGVSNVHEENFFKGMLWATLLSVPLWLSFFGWMKITISFLKHL